MTNFISYCKSVLCAFLIAITYIFSKKIGTTTSPEMLATLRFVISTMCFLPFVNFRECKKLTLVNTFLIILASFFGIFLYNNLLFIAVKHSSPINVSLVNAIIPLLTLALFSLLELKIPTKKQIFSFLLSFIGVFLVITKGVFTFDLLKTTYGELIMLIGATSWVLYGFFLRAITKDLSPLFATFITGLIGCIMLFFFSLHNQTMASIYHLTTTQWCYITYIGSFGTALVFFLYTGIIKKMDPTKPNLIIFSSAPIFVAFISYFFLATPLNVGQLTGGFFVLCALVLQAL